MGIDIQCENVMPLSDVVKHIPPVRPGRRPHYSTVWRWALRGVRSATGERVYLEYARVGATVCTSVEAVQRFIDRLSQADRQRVNGEVAEFSVPKPPRTRSEKQRERDIQRAEREWEALAPGRKGSAA